jgi:hypothetical protein
LGDPRICDPVADLSQLVNGWSARLPSSYLAVGSRHACTAAASVS